MSSMNVTFEHFDLPSAHAMQVDAVVLSVFADERPVQGPGASIDWRLCNALCKALQQGIVQGVFGEQAMFATNGKFPFDRIVLLGCGPSDNFTKNEATPLVRKALHMAELAAVRSLGFVLPGRSMRVLPPTTAVDCLFDAIAQIPAAHHPWDRIVVLDEPSALPSMRQRFAERRHHHRRNEELSDGLG